MTVNLAELGTQVSFARAAGLSRQLAGTTATAGQAHHALADTAALLSGTDGTLGPGHPSPDVVMLDRTGARAGANKNGVGVPLALGLTGRSGPAGRRRAHTHLLGLTVGEDWPAMSAQLIGLPAPALVVLDGETDLTSLTQQLWPGTPIQRCWWHLPHGLRKAFYSDDAANRHAHPALGAVYERSPVIVRRAGSQLLLHAHMVPQGHATLQGSLDCRWDTVALSR